MHTKNYPRRKNNSNFVILITLTAVLISLITAWFVISSYVSRTTGFAAKEILDGKKQSALDYPVYLRFMNINEADIISGKFVLGMQINPNDKEIKAFSLYLQGGNERHLLFHTNVTGGRIFYDYVLNTSDYHDIACGYDFMAEIFLDGRREYVYSGKFSIMNAGDFSERSKINSRMQAREGLKSAVLEVRKDYEDYAKENVRFGKDFVMIDDSISCAMAGSSKIEIRMENITAIEPAVFLDGRECTDFCQIKSFRKGVLEIEVLDFGNVSVREGFRFNVNIYNPSISQRKYSVGDKVPFYANVTDRTGGLLLGKDVECLSAFSSGDGGSEQFYPMPESYKRFELARAFNETGIFDWKVRCINITSGYKKEAYGRFQIRK